MAKNERTEAAAAAPKEFYELWCEYLQESERYHEYCEWFSQQAARFGSLDLFLEAYHETFSTALPRWRTENPPMEVPPEYDLFGGLFRVHTLFGDVFGRAFSFERLWAALPFDPMAITDEEQGAPCWAADETLQADMTEAADFFEATRGHTPSAKEFIDFFPRYLRGDEGVRPLCAYIGVSLLYGKGETLDAFTSILQRAMADAHVRSDLKRVLPLVSFRPTGKLYLDALRRYLAVYRLRKAGTPPVEVIRQAGEPGDRDRGAEENTQRKYRLYAQKAERIIANAERGIFPGDY